MRPRWIFSSLLASFVFLVQFSAAQNGDFTIIALPNTQNEAQFFPGVLQAQARWIVNHRAELNIQMVLGEGDIVNDFSDPEQQESAEEAFHLLDKAGVPYMLAIGNHDYDGAKPSHCTFDQNQIRATELTSTVKLTVFTTALASSGLLGTHRGFMRWAALIFSGTLLLGLILVDIAGGRRKGRRILVWLGLLCAVALVGCAGLVAPTNRGTFTITVTGTSGKVQKSTTIELALQ